MTCGEACIGKRRWMYPIPHRHAVGGGVDGRGQDGRALCAHRRRRCDRGARRSGGSHEPAPAPTATRQPSGNVSPRLDSGSGQSLLVLTAAPGSDSYDRLALLSVVGRQLLDDRVLVGSARSVREVLRQIPYGRALLAVTGPATLAWPRTPRGSSRGAPGGMPRAGRAAP